MLGSVPDTRCVVEYRWRDHAAPAWQNPQAAVIGKLYADETGERTYHTMRLLHAALAAIPAAPWLSLVRSSTILSDGC